MINKIKPNNRKSILEQHICLGLRCLEGTSILMGSVKISFLENSPQMYNFPSLVKAAPL